MAPFFARFRAAMGLLAAKNQKELAKSVKFSKKAPIRLEGLVTMSHSANNQPLTEQSLMKVYMDLTGATETRARSVFMHICCEENRVQPVNVNGMSPMSFAASNRTMPADKSASEKASAWTGFGAHVVPATSAA